MPATTPPKLPLPARVRLLSADARDANTECARVCAASAATAEARKAALAARREASYAHEVERDRLREMD